jgi:hypothetical protein
MAKLATDPFHPHVNSVAEIDGLLKPNTPMRIEIVEIEHN